MLKMNQIDTIKEMQRNGKGETEIAEILRIDRKTVRKYMKKMDFEESLTRPQNKPSKLDKWKDVIDSWLLEDKRMRFKQRHTAKRVHERLKEEYPEEYNCSYPIVQRYCKGKKQSGLSAGNKGNLELVWHASEAQVDFGEADFSFGDTTQAMKYLVLSFPSSNAAYSQVFGGETAECVSQGLKDIFSRIGGVPKRLVFDNASGVGRRIGDKVRLSDLFLRFKCHYGFDVTFCNPYSGHEKGNVENKVGYIRRNFFVPIVEIETIEKLNEELFTKCEEDMKREHYKKLKFISEIFEEEKKSLSPLPLSPFSAVRFEIVKTDGYGKFCLDGRHWYSSSPEKAYKELVAAIGAHYVEVLEKTGEMLVKHKRTYGIRRTETIDWSTTISRLLKNPGAWRNSGLRNDLPHELTSDMDSMDKSGLKDALRIMRDASGNYDFDTVILAMAESVKIGSVNLYNVEAVASRILSCGLNCRPDKGPDLASYDRTLLEGGL
jgi:transposase